MSIFVAVPVWNQSSIMKYKEMDSDGLYSSRLAISSQTIGLRFQFSLYIAISKTDKRFRTVHRVNIKQNIKQ